MISENIKKIRIENNLSQKEFANLLSVSNKTVSHWESGYTEPSLEIVIKIKKTLNVAYEDILE